MNTGTVRLYAASEAPRLRYIAGLILGEILGLRWEIITDRRKAGKHPVINYSAEKIPGSFMIAPATLLFEEGISEQKIEISSWRDLPVIFTHDGDHDLPFDIFAASFYLVARYEEYLPVTRDEHERFPAAASLAFRNGFLDKPVVDLWAKELARELLKKYNNLAFKRNEYSALLTVDADEYGVHGENFLLKSLGALFPRKRESGRGNHYDSNGTDRESRSPDEVFDYILEQASRHGSAIKFFFPVGDHSLYDKNPSWKDDEYRGIIKRLSKSSVPGLHASYEAAENIGKLRKEAGRLSIIAGNEITANRFHYCRLLFPSSYRDLADAGITDDYTMGFPGEPGFRAGIARPFMFYDIPEEKQTNIRIFPFMIMDETFISIKGLDPSASAEVIGKLISETKRAGGLFVSIWHNTSLQNRSGHDLWKEVFEFMLKTQSQ